MQQQQQQKKKNSKLKTQKKNSDCLLIIIKQLIVISRVDKRLTSKWMAYRIWQKPPALDLVPFFGLFFVAFN